MSDEVVKIDVRDITLVVIAFLALAAASVLLVVNLVFLTNQSHQLSRQAQQSEETHRAACSYRANLAEQAASSSKYLAQHPNGAPALGISAAQLRQSVERLQAAVTSLSDLHCKP